MACPTYRATLLPMQLASCSWAMLTLNIRLKLDIVSPARTMYTTHPAGCTHCVGKDALGAVVFVGVRFVEVRVGFPVAVDGGVGEKRDVGVNEA